MKKKLEAELVSIAHRVLKLKNREETKQLHQEAQRLYEQLTILRFYEENFETVKEEISEAVFEEKLENSAIPEVEEEILVTTEVEEIVVEETPEEKGEETPQLTETFDEKIEEETQPIKEEPQAMLFEDVSASDYKELDFVRVDDVPKEVEKATETTFEAVTKTEPIAEAVVQTKTEPEIEVAEPKVQSLNDRLNKGINIGLNDRIAFEKRLFNGSADDFNRVLSQLNTFDSYEEAKGFIDAFVKPDYNNWEGKEEYEERFLGIVEKKFS